MASKRDTCQFLGQGLSHLINLVGYRAGSFQSLFYKTDYRETFNLTKHLDVYLHARGAIITDIKCLETRKWELVIDHVIWQDYNLFHFYAKHCAHNNQPSIELELLG